MVFIPPPSAIVLFVIALVAMITNVHWYNQLKGIPCVADKADRMHTSYSINAVMIAAFIAGPIIYCILIYLGLLR